MHFAIENKLVSQQNAILRISQQDGKISRIEFSVQFEGCNVIGELSDEIEQVNNITIRLTTQTFLD